jgi:hypothetical protein
LSSSFSILSGSNKRNSRIGHHSSML